MSNIIFPRQLNITVKHEAFPYQRESFEEIKDLDYAAIFHEQGLGKTKIAIDLMLYWLEKRNIDTVMVVTKKQLVDNWINEFSEHTYITPRVLSSDKKNNFFVFNSATRIIVCNFEIISTEKERIKLFLKTRKVAIIIDESTKIKNPETKLTKDFFEIAPLYSIRVIMTGTPVANRPYDIWSQIYFLDFGASLGTDYKEFKRLNDLTNDLSQDEEKQRQFEESVSSIFEKIKPFTVRKTKNSGIISLPSKIYFNEYVDFEPVQKNMYEKIRDEMAILVQKGDKTLLDESDETLKRLLRLNEVASNPRLVDDLYGYKSGKEKRLEQLLADIIQRGEKVIVWTSYIKNVDYFKRSFIQYNPVKIHGQMTIEDRNNSVKKFKTNKECKVLFATPQSAKEGLTLTVASNVIFYDRGFNLDDYLQAQDRIHRISQEKECHIYNLIINDSIDVWIDLLLQAKQNSAFLAQGDYSLAKYQQISNYDFGYMVKKILNLEEN
jgi:SNF2 family DNA or RNA helicase